MLQRCLADILRRERELYHEEGLLTVTWVRLSADLSSASVYVSLYNIADKTAVMHRLHEKRGHIRKALGNACKHRMRKIPTLRFVLDDTEERSAAIDHLLGEG